MRHGVERQRTVTGWSLFQMSFTITHGPAARRR
jgi:hypothetical protein